MAKNGKFLLFLCIAGLALAPTTLRRQGILMSNFTNGSNYVGIMQNGLKWRGVKSMNNSGQLNIDSNGVTHNYRLNGNVITVTVGPNEMLVLQP